MPDIYPRLFCLVCPSAGTVEYSSTSYTAVKSIYNGLPEALQGCFEVVRYDANPNWKKEGENNYGYQR